MSEDQLVRLLAATIAMGTPLVFAAFGEILAESSGVLNLGVEGMMLVGAVAAFIAVVVTGSPWLGVVAGMLGAGALAAGHALLTVTLRADQVTAGLALALFGGGLSSFLGKSYIGVPNPAPFAAISVPGLSQLPILGRSVFTQDALVYVSYVMIPLGWWWLYRTRPGLHLRACGESPGTADAMGIGVVAIRYASVIVGGMFAGLGGAYLSLAYVPAWTENLTAGLGWIALALVIFATWNPLRLVFGAYLFGSVEAMGFRAQVLGIQANTIVLRMMPYVATLTVMLLLAFWRRRLAMPSALGLPYSREQ
ncbi:MAG: ABC transporter permease [Candidatus Rokubacteria bacterium 13_1_40CM_69_27]|nr:MAG: ABC transporter permease [Candidatus Rokubacteria bacterium 13_1_40CM_69_27]OLC35171.1 MAG: ABC transporter permease [Candidatus Rokubacteria bacterium 13_1_40CM_4_69_5]